MERIERLRELIYNRKLQQMTAARTKRLTRLAQARTIAICFPADDIKLRKQVLAYTDQLRKAGKSIKLLAYIPVVDKEATFAFEHYSNKEIGWARYPKGPVIEQFLSHSYDAFICLFTQTNPQIEFLSSVVQAGLRIGPRPVRESAGFDLMIDAPASFSLTDFIRCYEDIFAKASRPAALQEA
jgi:hypothetical protein